MQCTNFWFGISSESFYEINETHFYYFIISHIIDSVKFTVYLPDETIEKIISCCNLLSTKKSMSY